MADRVGQQFGSYRLLRLIGHGGFADVYLGEHIYIGTQAAIKLLHTQVENKDIERFQQEARTIAHLEHPHIVRVLDFGVQEMLPFLVLSYAPNGTLRERHPRGTVLSLPVVLEYVRQVADALQYAHNEKIIHRDIKPENMLIGRRNEILLTDFGIALVIQNTHSVNAKDLAGTAAYMSPEQIDAHPRAASDQYSLAIVVYEWLSGVCPFQGTFTEIVLKHTVAPVPPLRAKVPTLSAAVEEVIFMALAKDPGRRFDSVQSFARALEEASRSASTVFVPPSSFEADGSTQRVLTPRSQTPPVKPLVLPPSVVPQASLTPPIMPPVLPTPIFYPAVENRSGGPMTPLPPSVPSPIGSSAPESHTDSPIPLRRGRLSRRYAVLLVVLVLLVIGGGVVGVVGSLFPKSVNLPFPQALQTAIVVMQANHQQSVNAYNHAIEAKGAVFGFDAQHTRFNPYETILSPEHIAAVQEAWAVSTGAPLYYSSPTVANGVVYIGSHDHKLYAFDAINGRQKWAALTGAAVDSSPTVVGGIVYVGSRDGNLYAFDAETGQRKWVAPTKSDIYSSPTVVNGVVYVGSYDDHMYAFDAKTGHQKWATPIGLSISYSSPAVANGIVYVGSHDSKLYAFDAATGHIEWTYKTGALIYSSPTVINGVVYIASTDHNVYALNAVKGSLEWMRSTKGVIDSSPAVANGLLYIGSSDGNVYAFNAKSGQQKWIFATRASVASPPIVANGLVYIGSLDHQLYAIDAVSGQKKWSFLTGGQIYSSPMVANGVIYVGAADGRVYAFHLAK